MASIVKRGKTYSIVYYEGEGKDRHQVWESGLSYNAAKARKAQLEYEVAKIFTLTVMTLPSVNFSMNS